jgi:hypothetical protein
MLRCLIVGGGLQGMHLARVLVDHYGFGPEALRVLDPHDRPLALWKRLTRQCGMPYLRSPHTHNIDVSIMSLRRFWASVAGRPRDDFIAPYYRPSLALFNRHCDRVVAEWHLEALWVQGRASRVTLIPGGLRVATANGHLDTRFLVLAMGRNEHPYWPAWAQDLKAQGAAIGHLYDSDTRPEAFQAGTRTVIVGGGISAASLARRLVAEGRTRVTLLSRHPITTDNLDFDPCWAGPKCMTPFEAVPYDQRRDIVDGERRRGTVTQEVAAALSACKRSGRLEIVDGGTFSSRAAGRTVQFETTAGMVSADRVVLATGFERGIPGGSFTRGMIAELGLPVAPCGYPRLSRNLLWHDRIFVMGALAELAIGPAAGNIIGGRHAARRIVATFK